MGARDLTHLHNQGSEPTERHPNVVEFAGNYNLKSIYLYNHKGERIDIKLLVQEFNIYESI